MRCGNLGGTIFFFLYIFTEKTVRAKKKKRMDTRQGYNIHLYVQALYLYGHCWSRGLERVYNNNIISRSAMVLEAVLSRALVEVKYYMFVRYAPFGLE